MLVADATAAKNLLGFETKWNDLDTIIASAWAWYRKERPSAVRESTEK